MVSGLARATNGRIDGKFGSVITTLPANCRPNKRLIFAMNNHEISQRVDVLPDGRVVLYETIGSKNWYVCVNFRRSHFGS